MCEAQQGLFLEPLFVIILFNGLCPTLELLTLKCLVLRKRSHILKQKFEKMQFLRISIFLQSHLLAFSGLET